MFVKREGRIQDFYFMVRTPEAHEAPEFFSASLLTLARAHLIDSKLFNIIPYIFIQVRLLNSAKGCGQFMVRRTVRIPLNTRFCSQNHAGNFQIVRRIFQETD